jgi:LuxR family transcriptional regulator, maltose regulon positive regulatory protein
MMQTAIFRGRLAEAEDLARRGLGLIERRSLATPIETACHGTLAQVHFLRFQIEEAQRHFMPMLAMSAREGYYDAEIYYSSFRSRLLLCEGDIEAADREIAKADEALNESRIRWFDEEVAAQWTCVRLAQGRRAEAEARLVAAGFGAEGALRLPSASDPRGAAPSVLQAAVLRVLIRRALDSGDSGLLLECARAAGESAELALLVPNLGLAIELALLRGRAHSGLGDARAVLADYRRALAAAEGEGFVYPFAQEGRIAAEALGRLRSEGTDSAFLDRVLAALPSRGGKDERAARGRAGGDLVESLSRREREVLSLMAKGLSYQELSDALFVSINTIRSHVKSIYSKLGSENRTRAVERARELGILERNHPQNHMNM